MLSLHSPFVSFFAYVCVLVCIATGQENQPQTAQVLPCKFPNARTNEVVQEEAGGLLYALLFVLCCNFPLRL